MSLKKDTYHIATTRRTVAKFEDKEVSEELITLAIEAAVRAPNHKMTFPWKFIKVGPSLRPKLSEVAINPSSRTYSEQKIEKIKAYYDEAPLLLIAVQRLRGDAMRRKEDYASISAGIQNLSLVFWENGVAMKWSTAAVIEDPRTYELLELDPEEYEICGFLWCGYPVHLPNTDRPSVEDVYSVIG